MIGNALTTNDELLELFKQNAGVGTEDIEETGGWPQLKLTHKLSELELIDGQFAKPGMFYHSLTKKQYKSIRAHILYMNMAYLPNFNKTGEQMNYVLAGVLIEEGQFIPFITYIKGKSLQSFWAFQKEVSSYVKHPKTPVPLFAIEVEFSVGEASTEKFGKIKTIEIRVVKDDAGTPSVVSTVEIFQKLKSMVDNARQAVRSLLGSNAGPDVLQEVKKPDPQPEQENVVIDTVEEDFPWDDDKKES